MTYQRIRKIDIRDFRCLRQVTLDFTESPIVSLVGGNDSGKSSTVKAIQSIMYNDNQRESMGYVKTGSRGWMVTIQLEDGTSVHRERSTAGNLYRLIDASGAVVSEYTKLDKGAVPPEIQQIFGVFIDESTGELLNIRTCESLLLFALTKASENYKVMHSSLKVEQISKALLLAKDRINQLANARAACDSAIVSYEAQIRKIMIPDIKPAEQLKERIDSTANILSQLQSAVDKKKNIADMISEAGETNALLAGLEEISLESAINVDNLRNLIGKCSSLVSAKEELKKVDVISEVEDIDYAKFEQLQHISRLMQLIDSVKSVRSELSSLEVEKTAELEQLDFSLLDNINRVLMSIDARDSFKEELEEAVEQLEETQKKLNEALKSRGMYFDIEDSSIVVKCDSCGEENRVALVEIEKACLEAVN